MTACNSCGSPMVPDDSALVPALGCISCGRLIPRTGVRYRAKDLSRTALNRALRASRRAKMKEGRRAAN